MNRTIIYMCVSLGLLVTGTSATIQHGSVEFRKFHKGDYYYRGRAGRRIRYYREDTFKTEDVIEATIEFNERELKITPERDSKVPEGMQRMLAVNLSKKKAIQRTYGYFCSGRYETSGGKIWIEHKKGGSRYEVLITCDKEEDFVNLEKVSEVWNTTFRQPDSVSSESDALRAEINPDKEADNNIKRTETHAEDDSITQVTSSSDNNATTDIKGWLEDDSQREKKEISIVGPLKPDCIMLRTKPRTPFLVEEGSTIGFGIWVEKVSKILKIVKKHKQGGVIEIEFKKGGRNDYRWIKITLNNDGDFNQLVKILKVWEENAFIAEDIERAVEALAEYKKEEQAKGGQSPPRTSIGNMNEHFNPNRFTGDLTVVSGADGTSEEPETVPAQGAEEPLDGPAAAVKPRRTSDSAVMNELELELARRRESESNKDLSTQRSKSSDQDSDPKPLKKSSKQVEVDTKLKKRIISTEEAVRKWREKFSYDSSRYPTYRQLQSFVNCSNSLKLRNGKWKQIEEALKKMKQKGE